MFHVNQIKQKLGISGVLTEINSWYCKADPEHGIFGSQIDLLIARKDQVINLCEMKYANSEFTVTEKVDKSLRNKVSDLKNVTGTRYAIYPTLITTYGIVNNSYALDIQSVIVLKICKGEPITVMYKIICLPGREQEPFQEKIIGNCSRILGNLICVISQMKKYDCL